MQILKRKPETVESIRAKCEKNGFIQGEYNGAKWSVNLGHRERLGDSISDEGIGYSRFNSGGSSIVALFKSAKELTEYKKRLAENNAYIQREQPRLEAKYNATVRDFLKKGKTQKEISQIPNRASASHMAQRLPHAPGILAGSCLCSFRFNLDGVHASINEATVKFRSGTAPRIQTAPIWRRLARGFQPLLRLEILRIREERHLPRL